MKLKTKVVLFVIAVFATAIFTMGYRLGRQHEADSIKKENVCPVTKPLIKGVREAVFK